MIKKVNVGRANTAWLWLMLLPIVNGFVMMAKASKIFDKKYKFIGLACGTVPIIVFILSLVVAKYFSLSELELSISIILTIFIIPAFFYFICILSAVMMRNEYTYRKSVLDYANDNGINYKNFADAENSVESLVNKRNQEISKVDMNNLKNPSTGWLWLMLLPVINGFVLMKKAEEVIEEKYRKIGFTIGTIPILFMFISWVLFWFAAAFNSEGASMLEQINHMSNIVGSIGCNMTWILCCVSVVAGFLMRKTYLHRKRILDYADKYNILYNDFVTAENEVTAMVNKEKDKLTKNEVEIASEEKTENKIREDKTNIPVEVKESSEESILNDINNQIDSWMENLED